jgi:hypothetical protein
LLGRTVRLSVDSASLMVLDTLRLQLVEGVTIGQPAQNVLVAGRKRANRAAQGRLTRRDPKEVLAKF